MNVSVSMGVVAGFFDTQVESVLVTPPYRLDLPLLFFVFLFLRDSVKPDSSDSSVSIVVRVPPKYVAISRSVKPGGLTFGFFKIKI